MTIKKFSEIIFEDFEKFKEDVYKKYEELYPEKIKSEFIPVIEDPEGYIEAMKLVKVDYEYRDNTKTSI